MPREITKEYVHHTSEQIDDENKEESVIVIPGRPREGVELKNSLGVFAGDYRNAMHAVDGIIVLSKGLNRLKPAELERYWQLVREKVHTLRRSAENLSQMLQQHANSDLRRTVVQAWNERVFDRMNYVLDDLQEIIETAKQQPRDPGKSALNDLDQWKESLASLKDAVNDI